MSREEDLRCFFADVEIMLGIKLGIFCDRNRIFRSDFSNFRKGKKYYTSLYELELMKSDILDHVRQFYRLYEKTA